MRQHLQELSHLGLHYLQDWQYKWEHFLRPKSPFTAFFRRRTNLRKLKSAPPRTGSRLDSGTKVQIPDDSKSVDIPGTITPKIVVSLDGAPSNANVSDKTDSYRGIPSTYDDIQGNEDWQETQSLNLEFSHDHKQARKRAFSEAFHKGNTTETITRDSPKQMHEVSKDEQDTVSVKSAPNFAIIDETDVSDVTSLSAESEVDIDQYIVDCLSEGTCLSEVTSIHSGLLYPDDWILGEEEDRKSKDILKRGAKSNNRTRNREVKRDLNEWYSMEWGISHTK